MCERNQPPNQREEQPRQNEAQEERQQCPPPLAVHQRCEYVLEVAETTLGQLRLDHIAVAVLENGTTSKLAECAGAVVATPAKNKEKQIFNADVDDSLVI
jgi:hypothetical protein